MKGTRRIAECTGFTAYGSRQTPAKIARLKYLDKTKGERREYAQGYVLKMQWRQKGKPKQSATMIKAAIIQ